MTSSCVCPCWLSQSPGGWFNIKMSSCRYRKSHCGDKSILRPSYLHNGISYTGKMSSLSWIRTLIITMSFCDNSIDNHDIQYCCVISYYTDCQKDCSATLFQWLMSEKKWSDILWAESRSYWTWLFIINSSPPSAAYMLRWNGSALFQAMACHPFSAKSLP